ncbi:MAG: hypothetical protein Q9M89_03285 [Persephonella sp.]|nr:hypothetical protein [Persephonella sp.]
MNITSIGRHHSTGNEPINNHRKRCCGKGAKVTKGGRGKKSTT